MAKYSDELKLHIVQEYINGSLGYSSLAKKYGIPSKSVIERWVAAYRAFGKDGLQCKRKQAVYSVRFKVDVLHFMKQTGASYQETAIQFKLNNPSLLARWNKAFSKGGIEALQPKPKGRSSMSKKTNKTATKKEMSREEQLVRENELLRLEVAYLKKLQAFRENPETFLEKHKQRLPLNSKQKDSD